MTILRVFKFVLLFVLASSAFAIETPGPKERWTTASVEGFEIYSNASDSVTSRITRNLQSFRWAVSQATKLNVRPALPTRVYVFRDSRSFGPYRDAIMGKGREVAGIFLASSHGNYVLINAEAGSGEVVYHELIHFFASNTADHPVPVWFNEGLAEFYSTFQTTGPKFQIGRAIPSHIEVLRDRTWLPLDRLLTVNTDSAEYNEQHRASILYAESWAFVHYLLLGRQDPPGKIPELLRLLGENTPPDQAFSKVFGATVKELESELKKYVRKTMFRYIEFSSKEVPAIEKEKPLPISRDEAIFRLADLLANTREENAAEARKFASEAVALNPDHAGAHAILGWLAKRAGNSAEAQEHFARAAKSSTTDEFPYVLVAEDMLERLAESADGRYYTAAEVEPVRELLRKVIEINADSARAWTLLGRTYLLTQEKPNAGITALERSWKLAPAQPDVAHHLAVLYARAGDQKKAKAIIEGNLGGAAAQSFARAARNDVLHTQMEEGYRLVNAGQIAEGRALLQQVASQLEEGDLKRHLQSEIVRIEEHERNQKHVQLYNDAVSKAKRGEYAAAQKVLQELLSQNPEESLSTAAKALLDKLRPFAAKKK